MANITKSISREDPPQARSAGRARLKCLYIATFDPTIAATGTTTRGKFFLRYFAQRFDTHLIHAKDKHDVGRDETLQPLLASIQSVPFSSFEYFIFNNNFRKSVKNLLEKIDFDFIFADFEKAGLYALFLGKEGAIPYVYNSHNVEYLRYIDFGKEYLLRYLFVPYMYAIERLSCRNALFTVAISEHDAKSFRAWAGNDRVVVAPCAFEIDSIHPHYEEVPSDNPVILMVGNYRNPGNRDGAYVAYRQIVPEVVRRCPDAIFRFVGMDLPSDIQHPNVEYRGFVPNLMDEYREATVIIAPITIGGGVKIKVIEALASGKFLIASEAAMTGIDPAGLENLVIAEIDDFPGHIIQVIETRPPKTTNNWELVAGKFGTHVNLEKIGDRIEETLSVRPEGAKDEKRPYTKLRGR